MAVEDILRNIKKFTPIGDSKEALAERFTDVFQGLLSKAITDMESGKLQVSNMTELQRVYTMWKEVTDYQSILDDRNNATGTLPAISSRGLQAMDKSGVEDNTKHLEEMTDEESMSFIMQMMSAQNKDNVDEMRGTDEY